MKKSTFTLIILLIVVAFGCKKTIDPTLTKTDYISRTWQIQTVTATLGTTIIPGYTRAGASNLVNFDKFRMAFKSDGTYTQTEIDGTMVPYDWKFASSETQFLVLNKGTQTAAATWNIDELTASTLNFNRKIAANSTDPSDLYYLSLIQSYGLSTAAGVTLSLKAIPAQ